MNNLFGTAGIRALAGKYPLDNENIYKIGTSLAAFFINKYGINANVLIACDTRASSDLIKSLIKSGMLTQKINVYDAQVLSTPAAIYLVHELNKYDAGIIITASHNPYTDNGIKIVDRISGSLSNIEELEISNMVINKTVVATNFEATGKEFHVRSCIDTYTQKVLDFFSAQNFAALKNLKIVIDCANGATSSIAPAIFTKLGIKVIAINTNPNGTNINHNCGATHPQRLQKIMLQHGAQFGFAFDGDGDRVVAIDADGSIKNGDDLIGFLLTNKQYRNQPGIVGTVVSNLGLELWLQSRQQKFIRTDVGEKNLLIAMQEHNYLIGGEPSGHIILNDFAKCSDGVVVALKILETVIQTNNIKLKTFDSTPNICCNLPVTTKKNLNTPAIKETIDRYQKLIKPGRFIARYSGTENFLRLVLEGQDYNMLKLTMSNLTQELKTLLD